MTFIIDDVKDISKLLTALRLMVAGEFKINKEVVEQVVQRLYKFSKENEVSIKIVTPAQECIFEFTTKGIIIGASIGFYFGHIAGAILGASIGGVIGYAKAHIKIEMTKLSDDYVAFKIAK